MKDSLFRRGGPYNIRPAGRNQYSMSITLPSDSQGMIARECPDIDCSPGYFKVKTGTGITQNHVEAFCPYCRVVRDPDDFTTKAQMKYAESIVKREATKGVEDMLKSALGMGSRGRTKMDAGLFSIEMKLETSRMPPLVRPFEEELRRDLTCSSCGLEHAVFGLGIWCPDCGKDIFTNHVQEEFNVVKSMLSELDERRERLGPRVAAKDIENALEDTVSIFEASLKIQAKRHFSKSGKTADEVEEIFRKKIANKFQNIEFAEKICSEYLDYNPFDSFSDEEKVFLKDTFEKRHPITHNLGIIDRKYLKKVRTRKTEGQELRVKPDEILKSIELAQMVIGRIQDNVFKAT